MVEIAGGILLALLALCFLPLALALIGQIINITWRFIAGVTLMLIVILAAGIQGDFTVVLCLMAGVTAHFLIARAD